MSKPVTPEGIISYPHLFVPQEESNPSGMFKGFSVELLVDEVPEVLTEMIEKAVNEKWADAKKRKQVLENISAIKEVDHPFVEGQTITRIRFKRPTSFGPCSVFGRKMEKVEDVTPGNLGRVQFDVYCYDGSFGSGVGIGLKAVQITGEGQSLLSYSATDFFDVLDD